MISSSARWAIRTSVDERRDGEVGVLALPGGRQAAGLPGASLWQHHVREPGDPADAVSDGAQRPVALGAPGDVRAPGADEGGDLLGRLDDEDLHAGREADDGVGVRLD